MYISDNIVYSRHLLLGNHTPLLSSCAQLSETWRRHNKRHHCLECRCLLFYLTLIFGFAFIYITSKIKKKHLFNPSETVNFIMLMLLLQCSRIYKRSLLKGWALDHTLKCIIPRWYLLWFLAFLLCCHHWLDSAPLPKAWLPNCRWLFSICSHRECLEESSKKCRSLGKQINSSHQGFNCSSPTTTVSLWLWLLTLKQPPLSG